MSRFKCQRCNRFKGCVGPIKPEINGSDILIIGESPGEREDIIGEVFVGPSGDLLRSTLKNISDKFTLMNAVCCYGDSKITNVQMDACRFRVHGLIKKIKPKVVVALGNYALKSLFDHKYKITKDVGKIVKFDFMGWEVPVVFNFHPSYILRQAYESDSDYNRSLSTWVDVWNMVDGLLKKGLPDIPKVRLLTDPAQIIKYLHHLYKKESFAYDYETVGDLDALRPELNREFKILCVGVATEMGAVAFPIDYKNVFNKIDKDKIITAWKKIVLKDGGIAQNAKYEHKVNLVKWGFSNNRLKDTMLRMHVLNELLPNNLEAIGRWANINWSYYKSSSVKIQENPQNANLNELLIYCGLDALMTFKSEKVLTNVISSQKMESVACMQELFAYYLAHTEINGMHIDPNLMSEIREETKNTLNNLQHELQNQSNVKRVRAWSVNNINSFKEGDPFNSNSHVQMQRLCINELKLKVKRKSDGSFSFDKNVLNLYQSRYPIIKKMLEIRSLSSMITGFIDKWKNYIGWDNCVHTNYQQAFVVTGRLSSTEPNLQNITKDSVVRKMFNSRYKNGWIVMGDFDQLEPRILAGWSGDEGMIDAFNNDYDLHRWVASQIYDISYDEVTNLQRSVGKSINLGQIYGQTEYGLSEHTGLSLSKSQELMDLYNQEFETVAFFRNKLQQRAIKQGWISDLFGARRHLPDVRSNDLYKMNRALRQASNFPIQSTGNRFCLLSLCLCYQIIVTEKLEISVIGTTHDDIILDVSDKYLSRSFEILDDSMNAHNDCDPWKGRGVNLRGNISYGRDLYTMQKLMKGN